MQQLRPMSGLDIPNRIFFNVPHKNSPILPCVRSICDSREYVTFNENLYFAPFCVAPSRDEICCGWSWKILQSDVTFLLRKQHKTSPKNTAIDEDPCQMLASPSQTYQASFPILYQHWFSNRIGFLRRIGLVWRCRSV